MVACPGFYLYKSNDEQDHFVTSLVASLNTKASKTSVFTARIFWDELRKYISMTREQWEGVVGEEERFVIAFVNQFKHNADMTTIIDDDYCMEEIFRFRFTCNDDKDLVDKMVNRQDFCTQC